MRFALAALAMLFVWVQASAQTDQAATRKLIQRAYDRMAAGILKKDPKPTIEVLSPHFTNEEPGGRAQNRKQFIEEMKQFAAMTKSVERAQISINKFTYKGPMAIAEVRTAIKMTVDNSSGMFGKGKTATVEVDAQDREVWVWGNGRWLLNRSSSMPGGKFLVNGRSFGPPGG